MSSKSLLIYAGIFGMSVPAFAQQSAYFSDRQQYRTTLAEQLYRDKIYAASQYEFARQYFYLNPDKAQQEAALFYDKVIGVILNQNHAEEGLESFKKEYPNSAYFALAHGPLADYYLSKKDFHKALEELQKVNQYNLSREENTQYILKLGYAKFMTGDNEGAREALAEGYRNATGDERNDIGYMLGHLEYAKGNSAQAFEYFNAIKDNPKYSKTLRPYYLQMHFNNGEYDAAISEGKMILQDDLNLDYSAEVNKIIGESYFMQKDYTSAYPYLKKYLDEKSGNVSESDLYEIGFVAAQMGRYDEAVGYYNQLLNAQSPLAQNAYYQLGNAYLEVGKKKEALSAFRSASKMTYDLRVQQLAWEQYAKLGYEVGDPFESNSKVIQEYIAKYRDASGERMKKLLIKSYLYSGNYKETLSALEKVSSKSPELQRIEQEASFLLGTEEYNKGNYPEAENLFIESLKYDYNKDFTPRAQYWKGMSQYQMADYISAQETLQSLSDSGVAFDEKQQLPYDLAYVYFKSKDFAKAQRYFQEYLKNPNEEFKSDAELRLADTYYADNQLNEAIEIYDKVEGGSDYTLYQKAMSLGFKGDSEGKIKNLKKLISEYKTSEYVDDAEFEVGVAYANDGRYKEGNEYFDKVIRTSVDQDLVAKASIYRAQNYAEMGDTAKALAELKSVGEAYRGTSHAEKVVAAAKQIYLKSGDTAGYQKFADQMGVKISTSELDEINLSTAQKLFVQKDYKSAIGYYEKYLIKNPTGDKLFQAQYELGESYYQTKNLTKSLLVLQGVADVSNDYQEDAQVRIAQIYLAQNNSSQAINYLNKLVNSNQINIKNYALEQMMEISVQADNYKDAEKYADIIIGNVKNAPAAKEKAKVIKARSQMKSGKDAAAKVAYAALEKSANAGVAAEALYAKAYYQNQGKAYKSSNETIFKIANNYASEAYWGAKALVMMAKNYLGLGDKYQASYTVDQILANYQDFPEVIAEANKVKTQIKK